MTTVPIYKLYLTSTPPPGESLIINAPKGYFFEENYLAPMVGDMQNSADGTVVTKEGEISTTGWRFVFRKEVSPRERRRKFLNQIVLDVGTSRPTFHIIRDIEQVFRENPDEVAQ